MKEVLIEAARRLPHALNLSRGATNRDPRFARKGIVVDPDNIYGLSGESMTTENVHGKTETVEFVEV